MSPINAAIFILTQNNSERKIYLKTCLYFLKIIAQAKRRYLPISSATSFIVATLLSTPSFVIVM